MGISGSNLIQVIISALLLLLIAAVCVGAMDAGDGDGNGTPRQCTGSIGECFEEEEEMVFDWESNQRSLMTKTYLISYEALKASAVMCRLKGVSYYNCLKNASQANAYARGCTQITRCARDTG